jgi:very-short-patch-repair endonuclease
VISDLEETLADSLRLLKVPQPQRQYLFCPHRRWRVDFAWPVQKLAVEVEGGSWVGGAHVRPRRFEQDCRKYNQLALCGYRLLRFTGSQIKSGEALTVIEQALK